MKLEIKDTDDIVYEFNSLELRKDVLIQRNKKYVSVESLKKLLSEFNERQNISSFAYNLFLKELEK